MIKAVPFQAYHWMALQRDTSDRCAFEAMVRQEAGIAYTAIEGEMILGCAGIYGWNGTGGAWALLSEDLKCNHKIWFLRMARKLLVPVVETLGLHRVDALVDPAAPDAIKWIEWMGFEFEMPKRRGGEDGRDMLAYAYLPQRTL